jgi:Domain of unknown function (DUF4365)
MVIIVALEKHFKQELPLMGYDDDPIVDEYSVQSDRSVNAFNALFCQKNGFIARMENPDFGIDFTVELIRNDRATGNRFCVQLKSTNRLSLITADGECLISHQFKTSRLGLLARQPPGYGVIIIHDDTKSITYYDFVEKIVQRLFERNSDNWKSQNTVSIYIPEQNILNQQSIITLHRFYLQRFENHQLLISQHGEKFGIPDLKKELDAGTFNLKEPKSIADFLVQYGAFLFNRRDYHILNQLVSELPLRIILNNSDLLFTVAITVVEIGRLIEGDFYISACRKSYDDLDPEKQSIVELYGAELDFRLGRIDIVHYQNRMRQLLDKMNIVANSLCTRVRIDRAAVMSATAKSELNENLWLVPEVKNTIEDINESDIDELTKAVLILHAVENLNQLAINIHTRLLTYLRIQEKAGFIIPMKNRVVQARSILDLFNEVTEWQQKISKSLQKDKHSFLSFIFSYKVSSTFFQQTFSMAMLDSGRIERVNESRNLFQSRFDAAIYAFNGFIEIGAYDEAYSALTTALEIGKLFEHTTKAKLEHFEPEQIQFRIAILCKELDRPEYSSLVDGFFEETLPRISEFDSDKARLDIEPEQEDHFATTILEAYGLPVERKSNVISEIRANRKFYNVVANPDIELLQDLTHTRSRTTMYRTPPTYIAVCKICQYKTHASSNVDSIIEQFMSEHGMSCT